MKLAIVGSRNYPNRQQVIDYVNELPPETIVISGGASGVDTWAENAARKRGLQVIVIKPNWKQFGKSAGIRRNAEIVELCDELVAFWDGESRGTNNSIIRAKFAEKLRKVVRDE